ncbi:gamma carbonic anhydrase family protein [Devosia rhodophyticola]|uniref:Gamma carbonic anhydrase family protein n=1 Tax=Devosia rhodophyticola TaxID=3026423 RepID=A0ABY7Z167_9HYPH|nr:gamma carbonic anhydrase family protein [Devosia rhodophyticola]WDR07033.1 gamma carbonic anhydrase family protein [Devosia rhodophyticola]
MTLYALDDVGPNIDPEVAWIAPTAVLVGQINIARDVGVWFGVVARGDNEPITIGPRTNIQENTVLHTDMGFPLTVGVGCTIGHKAMLHGCTIGDNTLIGMGATILNGAKIGKNCLIGAGALITEGKTIPDNSLVVGAPGKVVRELDADAIAKLVQSADHYVQNARRFAKGCRPVAKHELSFDPT